MDRIVQVLTESWCDKKRNRMALRLRSHLLRVYVTNRTRMVLTPTFSPSESWCEKRNTDAAETDFLTFCALVWQKEHRWRWDWLSHLQGAGVTDKWNWALVWQMEHRWRWDWISHLQGAGVTNGTQMALRLNFSPSERWCDKWNTDGAETEFLTFRALVWQMEHKWRWDWLSHLLSAGVTNGKKMALRLTVSPNRWCDKRNADGVGLTFLPSKSWCDKWKTDGAETDFLTFWAPVWHMEHRWSWTDFLTFWALVWQIEHR